uniref:Si:dkey-184p18.2 n=1 Tax=Mastacembelus armatus TaxID=205130 RepID=A0A7N8XWT3_9TELE
MKTPTEANPHNFLLHASLLYRDTCPELSRFFLLANHQKISCSQPTLVCPYCYQWLQPGNHRMRLRPKKRPSARIQSILRRKAQGKRLSLMQKNLLARFQKSSSIMMATCHTCNKTSRHKGMNRDFIASLTKTHSTPGSTGKHKTPQSASRSSTPSNTPGSGSSSSKAPSKSKNWVVQRLSKILMREDNQGSKKGGLKDFLSSL